MKAKRAADSATPNVSEQLQAKSNCGWTGEETRCAGKHRSSMLFCVMVIGAAWLQIAAVPTAASAENAEANIEFFEKSVRPLLISACGECHGAKKQFAGLRLDSRQSMLTGGDTGPALVPGDPETSLLISAVRRNGDYEMPPEKPLTAKQVAILETWVKLGAPWPAETAPLAGAEARQRQHWAFQPMVPSSPPNVTALEQCKTPVDNFVLAKLAEASLSMSPQADRRTLIRRLTYDLTGLPPALEDVNAFINDTDPQAYPKLVDRLLNSPQYGEHWGRKWLDLARYADTKGYMFGWEIRRFVHSFAYRDWVVNAFNNDLPYDQFLKLQIAADQIAPDDPEAQAAMGFLTLGRRFLGNEHDVIDDRIDVISRTTMGLTVSCARCHDHKYDPIPTSDYYSLYGVLGNSVEQLVPACRLEDEGEPEFIAELERLQQMLKVQLLEYRTKIAGRMRDRITDYLIAQSHPEQHPNIPFSRISAKDDIFPVYVERVDSYLHEAKQNSNPVFVPWHFFAELAEGDFATDAADMTRAIQALNSNEVNPLVAELFQAPPRSMDDVAQRYGELLKAIDQQWRAELKAAKEAGTVPPERLSDDSREQLREVLYGTDSPCVVPNEHLVSIGSYFATRSELVEIWKFQTDIENFILKSANAPEFSVRLIDRERIDEPRVFRRGNAATKGDMVTRHFPTVVAGKDAAPFQTGSGRMEFAQGIAAPDNPLTARVWVNRIWQHHFGVGLVPTPSDFGTRAERPEHLQLLDWLAQELIASGWSTKSIHREILLSAAYQQQSGGPKDVEVRKRAQEIDPQNMFIWKMNPHRLTFEEYRDSMLAVSSDLDMSVGGNSTPIFSANDSHRRRTLYGLIERVGLPDAYRVFDFANPDLHLPDRSETTVPQQALFAINHPFVANRARRVAERLKERPPSEQVDALFETILQRTPSVTQQAAALQFLATCDEDSTPPPTAEQLAWQYGYGSLNKEETGIQEFHPLPYFDGQAWQGGTQWPDAKLGWVQLTAEGGHPGNSSKHASIRRWTATRAGTVTVNSVAQHEVQAGNGIRCWIVSSRGGVLNQFTLHHSAQTLAINSITVQPGDTLDFVVDINGELNSDQYLWSLSINETADVAGADTDQKPDGAWNSKRDFMGPRMNLLTPLEQLSQVLLLSNEFLFVD